MSKRIETTRMEIGGSVDTGGGMHKRTTGTLGTLGTESQGVNHRSSDFEDQNPYELPSP